MYCDLDSLMDLRKVVDFHFVRPFSSYVDGNDDFQAPLLLSWKLQVSKVFFIKKSTLPFLECYKILF